MLAHRRHRGPLQIQKALYPEGADICHAVVLHPPAGIAAGDELQLHGSCGEGARALLTTPGAARWYRSEGAVARQEVRFKVAPHATLEWLPRENIFFDGSRISMQLDVDLAPHAKFFGWEVLSFGRRAAAESWTRGSLQLGTRIRREDVPIWWESGEIDARNGFLQSPVGLRGFSVSGTFLVAGCEVDDGLLRHCREVWRSNSGAETALTRLPSLAIGRYLGHSSQEALTWFTELWGVLRRELTGRVACPPRIWAC